MRKPLTGSPEALRAKDLVNLMSTKPRWTSKEIREKLIPKYTAYDRDGLDHKIRHILSYLCKQGKIQRIDRGIYQISFN